MSPARHRWMLWLWLLPVLLALLPGCSRGGAKIAISPGAKTLTLVPVQSPFSGFSGLDVDASGALWAVPEQERVLVPVDRSGQTGEPLPILGIAAGADTESLAVLGPGRFAVGLESPRSGGSVMQGSAACDIALLVRSGKHVRLDECLAFPYEALKLRPERNAGIEGLCAAGEYLIAASETVLEQDGARHAAVGFYHRQQKRWTTRLLRLTSSSEQGGKISALACRAEPSGTIRLWAMERHFTVSLLLEADVDPQKPDASVLRPRRVSDLGPLLRGRPNLEGLALLPGDRIALINDSLYGASQVETVLLMLKE